MSDLELLLQASLHGVKHGQGHDMPEQDRMYRVIVNQVLTQWVKVGMNPMGCKGCDGDFWNRDMTRCCDESWCAECFDKHVTSHGAKND